MKRLFYQGADLFCGAGGTSEGMMRAARDLNIDLELLAINHWPVAIQSHSLNHPMVRHKCESLDRLNPREQVPGGRLHILAASPECLGHSNAAGGIPRNEQSRATAWHVSRWCSDLIVDNLFVENVREFEDWGPLLERGLRWHGRYYMKGRPDPRRKGQTFKAFIRSLEAMGYRVEYRIQCAAEFGDPTSRRRLIILARRDGAPIRWPNPTHGPGRQAYRTAREIIDWSIKGRSIFHRRRPLSPNTLDTITVKARFALVEPIRTGSGVDILFRMLKAHEYQAAMSFPAGYRFFGTLEDQIKQIGNAVPVELARAHARALLTN